jgi:catechol 2,3-dioxygenase-like lactoylglutathione lyase family enzyme
VLNTLDHVIVGVRDLDAAAEQTAAILGRPASWRGTHPELGTANALFRVANTYLELLSPEGEGPIGKILGEVLAERGEGLMGMAFGTDDADAAAAALRERGLTVFDPQPGHGRDLESGAERRWRNALIAPEASRGSWLFAIEHESASDALPMQEPVCERAAAVAALDHIVVMSPDVEATRRLYGDGLGLRLALDRSFEARGARILFFRVGGATVEVGGRLGAEPDPEAPDRLWGLAWQVPEADAAHARLAAADFDVTEVRDGFKPGTRVFTIRGEPSGVATLVIEPVGGLPK